MSDASTCPDCGFNHFGECVKSEEELNQLVELTDLRCRIEQLENHNHDLVRGTEYLTKRLGQEVDMTDKIRMEVYRLKEALQQILVVWTQPGRSSEETVSLMALVAKLALKEEQA